MGAVLLALLLCEGFLQGFDPGRFALLEARERLSEEILVRHQDGTLRLRPGARATYLGKDIEVGAHGLRNGEVVMPKPADVFRILVIGDSVPFGWGVAEDEAFPRLVERALAGAMPAGKRCEVVNCGVPGFGLPEAYVQLRDQGLAWDPDLVLHCVIANDVDPLPAMPPLVLPGALRKVRTLRLLERLIDRVWGGGTEPDTGWKPEQVNQALDMLVALCATKGARYVLMDTVALPEVVEHCTARSIPRVHCPVDVAWIDEHRLNLHDFHPGPSGHRWLADHVVTQLPAFLPR